MKRFKVLNERLVLKGGIRLLIAGLAAQFFVSDKNSNNAAFAAQLVDEAKACMVIGPAACFGLIGMGSEKGAIFLDEQRHRLDKVPNIALEINEVNRACANQKIPLAAQLADLFLLQHSVKAPAGSACDYAFEALIIDFFQKEYDAGMRKDDLFDENSRALTENGHPELSDELRNKINAYNRVGTVAHGIYRTQKSVFFNLSNYGSMPVHNERYAPNNDIASRLAFNNAQIEPHIKKITEAIQQIENKVLEKRNGMGWKPNCPDEIAFRDGLVAILADEIKAISAIPSKQDDITFSDDDNVSYSFVPK